MTAFWKRLERASGSQRRTVGAFPDRKFAINLVAARLRHVTGKRWSTKRYLNIELLRQRNALIT
jgi:putative transposase